MKKLRLSLWSPEVFACFSVRPSKIPRRKPCPYFPTIKERAVYWCKWPHDWCYRITYAAFQAIWHRPIMEHIANATNRYAKEYATYLFNRGEMGPASRIMQWRETDADELYIYFAPVIAMGISKITFRGLLDNRQDNLLDARLFYFYALRTLPTTISVSPF
ncbi:unnamed protein product [Leptidea sinapis]|uniref:PiggyBac transposable element-derived protein domain-containing protein n=1 Tax=Leptidea sinapis TaxID=189913 RepID=A0A5E4Q9H2_9NEOP|nr:unnamed protein product [Leptidea sinapis]